LEELAALSSVSVAELEQVPQEALIDKASVKAALA
jgi:hypothetical protein